jgi:hypothetical protein
MDSGWACNINVHHIRGWDGTKLSSIIRTKLYPGMNKTATYLVYVDN